VIASAALTLASAVEQVAAIKDHEVSSEELTQAYLDRIARYNRPLNAIVTIDEEQALGEARKRDRELATGDEVGPLHGLPLTVKDALDVAGMRSTAGIPRYREHVSTTDAEAVARVRRAGALILGKTNMPTANADFQSRNPIFGVTNNPWDLSRTPGGSCGGGGAAIAAALSSLELGSEIGGSLRMPAHFNGVYAHKSSYRAIPLTGHIPPGPDMPGRGIALFDLAVIGGLARSPGDLELLLRSIAGPPKPEAVAWRLELPAPRARELSEFRVGVWFDDPLVPLDSEVGTVLEDLLAKLEEIGARIDRRPPVPMTLEESHAVFEPLLFGAFGGDTNNSTLSAKSLAYFVRHALRHPRGQGMRARRFLEQKHRAWLRWDARRFELQARWADFFRSYDVLLMPVTPTVAPPHHNKDHDPWGRTIEVNGKARNYFEQPIWSGVANLAGNPATAAPAGFASSGLPVGLQIMGPLFEDLTSIGFARLLEEAFGSYAPPPGYQVTEAAPALH
jgi:amidase